MYSIELPMMISALLVSVADTSFDCHRKIVISGHGVSQDDRNVILQFHNKLRQAVAMGTVFGQPPAANMLELAWDEELAQRAQKWSISCGAEVHDAYRHLPRFDVGQNIATMWTRAPPQTSFDMTADFGRAIARWFDEHRQFQFGPVRDYSKNTGHYTQLVWGETDLIGCGFTYYYDIDKGFTKNYVCNYGVSGNKVGQEPYVRGSPSCEQFHYISSNRYHGLCEKPRFYDKFFYELQSNYFG